MNLFARAEMGLKVLQAHNSGKNRAEIVSEFGITESQVTHLLRHAKDHGLHVEPRRRGRVASASTLQRRADIVARYNGGESGPTIARALSITVETVYSALRMAGVARRHPSTESRNQSIIVRYQRGESGVAIARDLSVTPKVVYDALRKAGVIIRNRANDPQPEKV